MRYSAKQYLITCEHGGNRIPEKYKQLFTNSHTLLNSHFGYDPGALLMAKNISKKNMYPIIYETVSRLLVEQNRSRKVAKVFTNISSQLSNKEKYLLLETIYDTYHEKVISFIENAHNENKMILHFSIHTFTPVFNEIVRNADVGLLYDPSRKMEKKICSFIAEEITKKVNNIKVRKNYPYKGISDGFTTFLRKKYSQGNYCGIEIEINQKHFLQRKRVWNELLLHLPEVLRSVDL